MPVLPVAADYPIHTPHAELIRDEAHAIAVAHQVAAALLEHDAERDRTRQVPAEVVDLYSNSGCGASACRASLVAPRCPTRCWPR